MGRLRRAGLALTLLLLPVCGVGAIAPFPGHAAPAGPNAQVPAFVGGAVCATCHQTETELWQGSHHDLAMQEATETTVLGDFDDATFTAYGVTSRFFRKGDDFYVNTEGPDGKLTDYKIDYTFGVTPLQQYLISFPGGRWQVLGIAWDSRPADQGGQRWFHLYPDAHIAPGDFLHWTQVNQNWNYMCADCHSTNLARNFDLEKDRYQTTWSEIDVSCEACHGPGEAHVAWARAGDRKDAAYGSAKGLAVGFDERRDVGWEHVGGAITATRSEPPLAFRTEVETCGRCHARRSPLGDAIHDGKPLLDSYRVALLTEDLYHPDGQIKDEVYVYGSFLQSRMYTAGVTCSDCHDPHSLKLRADGNDVCTRCHRPAAFDTPTHHFHASGAAGSRCVDCHAPETTYMVVDPRRDHSFRIPRLDLSVTLGTPNACSGCHDDKDAQWAADRVVEWHGPTRKHTPHYGEAIAAGRSGAPGAEERLVAIATDEAQPGLVRATAVDMLGRNLSEASWPAIGNGLQSKDPLVRRAAVGALEALDPRQRFGTAFPLLQDPVRAVRLETARMLAAVPLDVLAPEPRGVLQKAFADYEEAHQAIADRPENLTTLANFHRNRGDAARAEALYRETIRRYPTFAPAYVNLADLYRTLRQEETGREVLRDGLARIPEQADLNYAFGLLLIRQGQYAEAVQHLKRAAEASPDTPRYSYVYALSLQKIGSLESAATVLEAAHELHPNDREILFALATMSRDRGDLDTAVRYAETLLELSPTQPEALQLYETLRSQQR